MTSGSVEDVNDAEEGNKPEESDISIKYVEEQNQQLNPEQDRLVSAYSGAYDTDNSPDVSDEKLVAEIFKTGENTE